MQWAVKAYHHAETYFNVSKLLTNNRDRKPMSVLLFLRCMNAEHECRVQIPIQMCMVDCITNTQQSYKNHTVLTRYRNKSNWNGST